MYCAEGIIKLTIQLLRELHQKGTSNCLWALINGDFTTLLSFIFSFITLFSPLAQSS